jgi:hypothetical protein
MVEWAGVSMELLLLGWTKLVAVVAHGVQSCGQHLGPLSHLDWTKPLLLPWHTECSRVGSALVLGWAKLLLLLWHIESSSG